MNPASADVAPTDHESPARSQPAVELPPKPGPTPFAILATIGAIVMTVLTARAVGFSFSGLFENLGRKNSVIEGSLLAMLGRKAGKP